jgi:hypothetical protein
MMLPAMTFSPAEHLDAKTLGMALAAVGDVP